METQEDVVMERPTGGGHIMEPSNGQQRTLQGTVKGVKDEADQRKVEQATGTREVNS